MLAVAGNTTMTHLFMGLSPRWIIREPYIPVVNKPPLVKARSLGIQINPNARALMGTNAEVVLGNRNWLIACAGAAGPALEGGVTRMGMTAGPGVIDKIAIDPDTREFKIHTIEQKPPRGICGSGVIDLAAQMFLGGMIDIRGKFLP